MMTETHVVDMVIIGAGIAGAGVAAMLGSGVSAVLLEQEERPGYHSTGRSAAIFIQNYGPPSIRALTRASREFLLTPPVDFFENSFLSRRGLLMIAGEDGREALQAELAEGEGFQVLSPDQAVEMVPLLRRDGIVQALLEADTHDIDVDALHQAYLRQARRNGVGIRVNAALQKAERSGDVWTVQTAGGTITARTIVNAAGAWADTVAEMCGIAPFGITPKRRSMAVLPAPEADSSRWPLVIDVLGRWYMKPDAGRLLVSPSDEDPVPAHDAWVDDTVLAEGLYEFEKATHYEVTRVENQWAGLRSFAADGNPVVGFDAAEPGFFWLAGQGGYGIQTSPALSRLAADLLTGRTPEPALGTAVLEAITPGRHRNGTA